MSISTQIGTPHSGTSQMDSTVTRTSFQGEKKNADRRHDLDALRAFAMLLGIVLHAALSFAPIPWTVQDAKQGELYEIIFSLIHGFRMPLFFLISGFFTAMLWRRYGLGGLLKQRLIRIVVPLAIGCITIVPAMWAVSSLAMQPLDKTGKTEIFDAVAAGDVEKVEKALNSGLIEIDELHPSSGASLLTVATFCGQTETVKMLLRKGADANQVNRDKATPIHVAVFMGRVEPAKLLIQAGANLTTKDGTGNTPVDNLKIDFATTNFIASMYGLSLNEQKFKESRGELARILGEDQAAVASAVSTGLDSNALYGLLFQLPVWMHLWFLAFLCWLILGFAAYAFVARNFNFARIPKWIFCSPLSLLWLIPLTMLPQSFMVNGTFGPDPSIGLLPIPSVLAYYAIFFFFGVIYWEMNDSIGMLGRHWYVALPVSLFIIFPVGLELVSGTFGFLSQDFASPIRPMLGNLFQALFVWLTIFGLIGLFRDLLSRESKTVRYVSDSSYWLYLAHLPLVILAQWLVRDLQVPALCKFAGIICVTTIILLVTYEFLVRYSIIGRILNGPREREKKALTA